MSKGNHPISPSLYDLLESGVREIVRALNEKGYLTVSSCEGHDNGNVRHVTLVFPTLKERDEFLKLPTPDSLETYPFIGFMKQYPMEADLPEGSYKVRGNFKYSYVENNNNEICEHLFNIKSEEWCALNISQKKDTNEKVWLDWICGLKKR